MAESFGALLRKCRQDEGLSLGELARRINYSKSQVSKIENGHAPPNPMFAKLCDRELGTDGVLVAAVPVRVAGAEPAPLDDVWVLELSENGEVRYGEVPHRPGGPSQLGVATAFNGRASVDDRALAALRATFDQFRTLGTMTSPAAVLAPTIAHVHTLRTLAGHSPEPMRSELLLLAARVAEYVGWMCQESGRESDALRWTERAVILAAGRDPQLVSFALFRRAEVALYQGNPRRTIELAQLAQQDKTASPRILGLAARCEAQGHAIAGDARAYEEALDRAAGLLAIRDDLTGPVLGSASVPDEVALVRGWSLYDLGRPGAAAQLLDEQLPVIPLSARRARARFGVRRALAHAQNGDITQACAAAYDVLVDAALVDSATIRLDLRELARTLGRWHANRAAGDLRQELVTMLR